MRSRPRYRQITAADIKAAIPAHDFYLRELGLSRYGSKSNSWAVAGICPFHPDRKAGSFKINLETGGFQCWSCGASGGDIITFTEKRYDFDYRQAAARLIDEWGLNIC